MSLAVDTEQAFLDAIVKIADEVAAPNADDVDRNARFPSESIAALRAEQALSAFVPTELGGAGVSLETIAHACFELGRRCGASAMVFAMHQIQVVTIVRHLEGSPWFEDYLRSLVSEQRLIASITSEIGTGGDMGRSVAAVVPGEDGTASIEKQAPTVSYGAHADDYLTTVRSGPDAEAGDQVVVLHRADQVMATPYSTSGPESMVPVSHILWSQLWLGIATDAFDRARAFVRAAAKRSPGTTPPAAQKLSAVMSDLSLLRAEVGLALREFEDADRGWLSTMQAILRFSNLKIAASEQAPRVCQGAMGVGGIVAFKNDTPFSVGRHLRDSMSACLMIANERIHATNASLLLIAKEV